MTYHEDLYMIYRDRLRALREDSDLSQKTIADYLGIGQTTYSQYELGKRSMPVEYIIRLCQFYNVSADYMLGLSNEKIKISECHAGQAKNGLPCVSHDTIIYDAVTALPYSSASSSVPADSPIWKICISSGVISSIPCFCSNFRSLT